MDAGVVPGCTMAIKDYHVRPLGGIVTDTAEPGNGQHPSCGGCDFLFKETYGDCFILYQGLNTCIFKEYLCVREFLIKFDLIQENKR